VVRCQRLYRTFIRADRLMFALNYSDASAANVVRSLAMLKGDPRGI
jgi:hypothetical protein